jgi:ubiquinone/menaquinone biosynthesis C-methylase UbiE
MVKWRLPAPCTLRNRLPTANGRSGPPVSRHLLVRALYLLVAMHEVPKNCFADRCDRSRRRHTAESMNRGIGAPAEPGAAAPPDVDGPSTHVKRHARTQFEKWALSYDRSRLNELVFFPGIRTCQMEIARWQTARGPKPYRLLDVGCGTGSLVSLIARDPDAELLVGLDYASAMVEQSTRKFAQAEQSGRLRAVRADAEHLPFGDASFDVVTCCHSFHHYPHQAAVVRGFRRVLRPGGLLLLIDGFRDNVIGWVVFDVGVATVEGHVHHASWSELRRMILDAGFTNLRQRKSGVLAPLLVNAATV